MSPNDIFEVAKSCLQCKKKHSSFDWKQNEKIMQKCVKIVMIFSFFACLDCGCVLRSTFFGFSEILECFGPPSWRLFGIKVMKKWGLKKWWKKGPEKGPQGILREGCGSLKRRHWDCSATRQGHWTRHECLKARWRIYKPESEQFLFFTKKLSL